MKNTNYKGRDYKLTEQDMTKMPNFKSDLIERGFDGIVYYGNSKPVGRQRREIDIMFFCESKTGKFIPA